MILWTIQPERVYQTLLQSGQYICDPRQMAMPDLIPYYDWLAAEMTQRIGPPPDGVRYPVWAWHTIDGKRSRPAIGHTRWGIGRGYKMICLAIEVPDDRVLLSDFDSWSIILNDGLITWTEQEDNALEAHYRSLSPENQHKMKRENWQRVFDTTLLHNAWCSRGQTIQATFWVLTSDMIRDVKHFTVRGRH